VLSSGGFGDKPESWKANLIASAAALLHPAKLVFRSIEIAVQTTGQESSLADTLRTPRVSLLREETYDDGLHWLEASVAAGR
jgi:hypothetical protein